ncbi:hypothetical protein LINPERPRIM_LOCUS8841 [Linum perenne]
MMSFQLKGNNQFIFLNQLVERRKEMRHKRTWKLQTNLHIRTKRKWRISSKKHSTI